MSLRVRTFIAEEMEIQRDLPEKERLDSRRKILARALEMATEGKIVLPEVAHIAQMDSSIAKVVMVPAKLTQMFFFHLISKIALKK